MKRIWVIAAAVLAIMLATGCSDELELRIAELEKELSDSQQEIAGLTEQLEQSYAEKTEIEQKLEQADQEALELREDLAHALEELAKSPVEAEDQLRIELNGDGQVDRLLFLGQPDADLFTLHINDSIYQAAVDRLEGNYNIVDIDKNDPYKEIAVFTFGPDQQPLTTYYYYADGRIFYMGEIPGHYPDITYSGNGSFTTSKQPGNILHQWEHTERFGLDAERTIELQPFEMYEMNTAVTLLQPLPLYVDKETQEETVVAEAGEKGTIVATDNESWCLIELENGDAGWFEVKNFNFIPEAGLAAEDVFEGLTAVE